MKIVLAGAVAALAGVLALASASREQDPTGPSSAVPPAASSSSSTAPAQAASPGPPTGGPSPQPQNATSLRQPRDATPLPPSAPVSDEPTRSEAAPAKDTSAVSDAQLAALQQLVEQSRVETERLARIDGRLASAQRQSADQELGREAEVEQAAAQHAATLEALDILRQAEALLATGDSDGVDGELGRAEAALFGRTRIDVDAAREALGRSDLYAARIYLAAALAERRPLR
jgi:hypothetical protein